MLEPIFQFAEKFITDFSWRRIAIFFSFIMMVGMSFMLFEWQTSTYELSRYERASDLLSKLEPLVSSETPEISDSAKSIIMGVGEVVRKKDITSSLEFSASPELAQSFFAILPWVVFFIMYLPVAIKEGKSDAYHSAMGFSIIIIVIGILTYFMPTEWSKWIRYGGVQLGNFALFMLLSYIGNKE